jgi:hypothetical protein
MSGRRAQYELKVSYEITHADDIDILGEGEYAHELYGSPLDALGDLGHFISQNGGPDAWDELTPYEIASCWLPDGPHTEIAYHARLDRVTTTDDQGWTREVDRQPASLTWGRLNAASFGVLRRQGRT